MSDREDWNETQNSDALKKSATAGTSSGKNEGDGSNGASDDDVRQAFQEILSHYEELASEHASYMSRCRQIRTAMAEVYDTASDRGITRKILKAKVKEYRLTEKLDAIRDNLSEDDQREFDKLTDALGSFGDTPLGAHALSAAKERDEARFGDQT